MHDGFLDNAKKLFVFASSEGVNAMFVNSNRKCKPCGNPRLSG